MPSTPVAIPSACPPRRAPRSSSVMRRRWPPASPGTRTRTRVCSCSRPPTTARAASAVRAAAATARTRDRAPGTAALRGVRPGRDARTAGSAPRDAARALRRRGRHRRAVVHHHGQRVVHDAPSELARMTAAIEDSIARVVDRPTEVFVRSLPSSSRCVSSTRSQPRRCGAPTNASCRSSPVRRRGSSCRSGARHATSRCSPRRDASSSASWSGRRTGRVEGRAG